MGLLTLFYPFLQTVPKLLNSVQIVLTGRWDLYPTLIVEDVYCKDIIKSQRVNCRMLSSRPLPKQCIGIWNHLIVFALGLKYQIKIL